MGRWEGGGQVGGGWAGRRRVGGGGGGWKAEGGLKQPFGLKQQCCAFSAGSELVQSTGLTKNTVRSSLIPHAVLLMPSGPRNASS